MVEHPPGTVPFKQAWQAVGRVLFGDDFIERLSAGEKFLIAEYGDPTTPGGIANPWRLPPPALADELAKAVHRKKFKLSQDIAIASWFEAKGFVLRQAAFDRDALDSALGRCPTASVKPRPLNERAAAKVAKKYIDGEKDAHRRPTLVGCEAAARAAGWAGGRGFLRTAYRRFETVKIGRPGKSPGKVAKK